MHLTSEYIISDEFSELDLTTNVNSGSSATVSNGVLTLDSIANSQGFVSLPVYAKPGSVVEIVCEAKQNEASSGGRFGITANPTADLGGVARDLFIPDTLDWKPYKISSPMDVINPYAFTFFGMGYSVAGNVSFRKIKVRVYENGLVVPESRHGIIDLHPDDNWGFNDEVGGFSSYGLKSVQVVGNDLEVKWTPMSGYRRPIITIGTNRIGAGKDNNVYYTSVTNDGCLFSIYDHSGIKLDLSSFNDYFSFSFEAKLLW